MHGFDPGDSRPSYQQVGDHLREAIEEGKLAPGAQLPTHKALSDQYGVAIETVKRALSELRAEGRIITRQGKGSYVRRESDPPTRSPETPELAAMQEQIEALTRRLDEVERRLTEH